MIDPEKVKAQKRRHYLKHKEQIKLRVNAYYHRVKESPEFKEKKLEYQRRWRATHWKKFVADACKSQRAARKRHPEHYREKERRKMERVKADPIRYAAWQQRCKRYRQTFVHKKVQSEYRARKRGAKGSHTAAQWLARVQFYGWRCVYCGKQLTMRTLTQDHRIPLKRGGTNFAANLVPACRSCNCRKGSR